MDVLTLPTKHKGKRLTSAQRKLCLDAALAEVDAQLAHANEAQDGWSMQSASDRRAEQVEAWAREINRLQTQRARILAEYHKREFFLAIQK